MGWSVSSRLRSAASDLRLHPLKRRCFANATRFFCGAAFLRRIWRQGRGRRRLEPSTAICSLAWRPVGLQAQVRRMEHRRPAPLLGRCESSQRRRGPCAAPQVCASSASPRSFPPSSTAWPSSACSDVRNCPHETDLVCVCRWPMWQPSHRPSRSRNERRACAAEQGGEQPLRGDQ